MLNPLELELQMTVSYPMWMLGIELRFSGRATNFLKHRVIFPAPLLISETESHYVALAG